MAIIVLSVPHTGTRFLCRFLDSIGVIYRQYHSELQNLEDLQWETDSKAVIPIRDPLLCFTSTYCRAKPEHFEAVLRNVVTSYDLLLELEKGFDFAYLRLDDKDYISQYEKLKAFTGSELPIDKTLIAPVGQRTSTPTDYDLWSLVSKHWSAGKKQSVTAALRPYREYYGY